MENGTIVCIKIFLDPMRQKFLYIHPNSQYQSVLRDYDFHSNRAELLMIKNVRVLNEDDLELVEIGDDQIYRFVETNWMSDPSKVLLKPLIEGPPITFSFDDESEVFENVRSMLESWEFEEQRLNFNIPGCALRLNVLSTWFRRYHRNDTLLPPFSGPLCETSAPFHLKIDETCNESENEVLTDDFDIESVSGTLII